VLSPVDFASQMGRRVQERSEVTALGTDPLVLRPSVTLHRAGGRLSGGWCKVCELLKCSWGGTGTIHRVDPGILASEQCTACILVM
jgi:hypothetical protein